MICLPYRPEDLVGLTVLSLWKHNCETGMRWDVPKGCFTWALSRKLIRVRNKSSYVTRLGEREITRFERWMTHEWKPFEARVAP